MTALVVAHAGVLAAQQPQAPPPPPNRANEAMPSWLRLRGEFRERAEGFGNSGFTPDRSDLYFLTRVRLAATATANAFAATIQVQDARVGGKSVGPTGAPFKAAFDLRQAFLDVGSARAPVAARLGRQEITLGDQRLVGHTNWANAGRTFDGAKVTVRATAAQVDLFAASVVRILDGEFDKSGAGHRLAGVYVSSGRIVPQGTLDPYLLWRRDVNQRSETGTTGSLDQVTAGARLAGRMPARLDYNVEMALQRGSLGPDSLSAWAGHWLVRRSLPSAGASRIAAEYNYASGDANPADGMRGTFDQLYPTAHDKYGLADQVGWRNIHHLRLGVEVTPIKATPVALAYNFYWLAERRDALYAASGAALARVAAGASSRRVGHELDVQATRALAPYLSFNVGYARLFPGPFLKQATPGRSYSTAFAMVSYVFLADR